MKNVFPFILLALGGFLLGSAQADPFVDRVVEVNFGSPRDADFETPSLVLGAPRAWGDEGLGGSMHVLNIGIGGSVTVEFTDNEIFDGPGIDFVVFENPFYQGGDFDQVFIEPACVYVSSDGDNYTSFPLDYIPPTPALAGGDDNPDHYVGFAGIRPVFSNPENGISPLDPSVSGGDPFDLALIAQRAGEQGVDVDHIRFIRIEDLIRRVATDKDGDVIPGSTYPTVNGFDLDAIAGINTRVPEALTGAGESWLLYE